MQEDSWVLPSDPPTYRVNGEDCYLIRDFALMVQRTITSLYNAIKRGNQLGQLKAIDVQGRFFIPKTELKTYQFINSGRYGTMHAYTHRYDPKTLTVIKVYTKTPIRRSGEPGVDA
jgi:hypothetical protein